MKIQHAGPFAPWLVLVGAALLGSGCRSRVDAERREVEEARRESREERREAAEDLDAAQADAARRVGEADAEVAEEERELRAAEGRVMLSERTHLDDRLDRLDQRMLELQAAINKLGTQGDDNSAHQATWEAFDQRRSTIKRDSNELGVHSGAGLEERKRRVGEEIDGLEAELETAIEDIEASLIRG